MNEKPSNTGRNGMKSQLHGVHHHSGSGQGNIGNSSRGRGGYNNCNTSNTRGVRKMKTTINSTTTITSSSSSNNPHYKNSMTYTPTGSNSNIKNNRIMKEYNRQKLKEKEAEAAELAKMTNKLNSEVIKRKDSHFEKIIKVSAQVALYEYDCSIESWKKTNTSGSLFLYKRVVEPRIGLFILNRNSLENFALMITPDIEVQVEQPNMLMKTDGAIRCLWFYNQEDCEEVAKEISKRTRSGPYLEERKTDTAQIQSTVRPDQINDPSKKTASTTVTEPVLNNEGSHILQMLCGITSIGPTSEKKDPLLLFQNFQEKENSDNKTIETMTGELSDLKVTEPAKKPKVPEDKKNILNTIWPDQSSLFKINLDVPSLFSNLVDKDETGTEQRNESQTATTSTNNGANFTVQQSSSSSMLSANTNNNNATTSNDDNKDADTTTAVKRRPSQRGTNPKKDLDSLGAELRATLGITNASNPDVNLFAGIPLFPVEDGDDEIQPPTTTIFGQIDERVAIEEEGSSNNSNQDLLAITHGFSMESWQNQVREIMEKGNRESFERQNSQNTTGDGPSKGKQRWPTGENLMSQIKPQGDRPEISTTTDSPCISSSYDTSGTRTFLNHHQLLQATMYLLKTESGFAGKLEAAYIKSLSEN